jgi:ABC-type transport system involved in cytochrome bd biosynthesis fused ATPase/permease subunit
VAVVGATGSGKTTLLRTLLGLEGALGGEVRFGGQRIDGAEAGPQGRPFAWVPQEAPLLADTITANVALAPGAGDAREALEAIGAARLLEDVGPSPIGAGGRALSGGERQWVSLARAVATRQPVLLLDEPTSGLDSASQARVLEAIARLRGERTVLLVTHREEPLAIADAVVRLDAAVARGPLSDTCERAS